MNSYWDVGQFFSVSMLASDVGKAVQAAEKLFRLKPPIWWVMPMHFYHPCQYPVLFWKVNPGVKGVNTKNNNNCCVFPSDFFIKAKLRQKGSLGFMWRKGKTDRHPHIEYILTCCVSKTKLSVPLVFSDHVGSQEQSILGNQSILYICEKADSKAQSTPSKWFPSQMEAN